MLFHVCLALLWMLCQFGGLWVRNNQIHRRLGRSVNKIFPSLLVGSRHQQHHYRDRCSTNPVVPHQDVERDVVTAGTDTAAADEEKSPVPHQDAGTPVLPFSAADYANDIQALQGSIEQLQDEMQDMHSTMMQYFGGKGSKFVNNKNKKLRHT